MSTTFCITTQENRVYGCLFSDNRLIELQVYDSQNSLLGNIYVGKVKNVLKNIEAAFVEIAGGRKCFLPFSEAKQPVLTNRSYDGRILAGDELLVQVSKDAVKTKDPVLTARLSFEGKYICVQTGINRGVHYSKKLTETQKDFLKPVCAKISLPEQTGLLVRTKAGELTDMQPLLDEAESLLAQAGRVINAGRTRTVFSMINQEIPGFIRQLQEMSVLPERIVTDQASFHTQLLGFLKENWPNDTDRLHFYQDSRLSLFQVYGLSSKISEALGKQVWLKSGGYLVIEPTEALTVVDVNTGKYSGKSDTEETFYRINQEAAEEIAHQLRLRNISGIVLVDFINLKAAEKKSALLARLRQLCSLDPVPTRVVDMTALGLVELTRKKVHRSLAEQIFTERKQ